ncbi:hypothetical protein P4283_18945 [Bacillus thuringiensis]|nr:hypothetical protein [Bacillus thuringiensis]
MIPVIDFLKGDHYCWFNGRAVKEEYEKFSRKMVNKYPQLKPWIFKLYIAIAASPPLNRVGFHGPSSVLHSLESGGQFIEALKFKLYIKK